ncbi:MAG TPA: glycosyltransferase [Flavobacteriales bacterium]|jgi:dolichol-phosphate mannosyltransferase|nr:glycosyltransferase [Flavobacteriales bacterium]MBP9177491.1 glycosyltransferase [Flavobacteriales bacterium]HQW05883.1 glycosyltransferase [Flavobacteriales bacterium]HQW98614.1 glycosyltransferase [Flavobacteriales bacterium]HQX99043.1 glycosyltransferase [Flavobacteriales bacterium]
MYYDNDWALIIPLANEEEEFELFTGALTNVLDRLESGKVYLIVDGVSKDRTLELCTALEARDPRFRTVWAPENRNVVDAYLRGYREAFDNGHELIIEMDAGLSHDPRALPMFLRVLNEGNECAFGSRFINGGSITESSFKRLVLSKVGTVLSNLLLGTRMYDMTSGYQGFHRNIVGRFLAFQLRSKAHFYQTELRYLLRFTRYAEIPIHYKAPSPRVSEKAIRNSIDVLLYYFKQRLIFRPERL